MTKIFFILVALFFSYKIFTSEEGYKKLLWVILGMMFLHNTISIAEFPVTFTIHRWLIYSLFLSEFIQYANFKEEFKKFPFKIITVILFIAALIIAVPDSRLSLAQKILYPLTEMFDTYFIVFFGYFAINNETDLKKMFKPIFFGLLIVTLYGLYNWIIMDNPYHEWIITSYLEKGTSEFQVKMDMLNTTLDRFRASSTFDMTFNYGFVSSLLALFSFTIYYMSEQPLKRFALYGIIAGFIGAIICFSRTVLASMIIALAVFVFISTTLKQKIVTIIVILLISLLVYNIIPSVQDSVDNTLDIFSNSGSAKVSGSDLAMRALQMIGAYHYFIQKPITGNGYGFIVNELGWGNREHANLDADMAGFESIIYQLMIEQGFVGLFTKLLFFIVLGIFFIRRKRVEKRLAGFGLSIVILFFLFAIATGSLGVWPISMLFIGMTVKTLSLMEINHRDILL